MEPPNLIGGAQALYVFIQAQLQEVHNAMATMTADITALRNTTMSAAVNEEMQNRFAATDHKINTINRRMEVTAQAWETKLNTLSSIVAAMGTGGTGKKKDITESKPVNNLKEFGGGDREQFRE